MGNSPLTVCIHQAWEKQTVQVVLPDGQVLFLPHPLTASSLMAAHPYHFVCQGSPSLLEQRLPMDAKLLSGELYYLIPVPPADFPVPKAPPAMSPLPGGHSYGGGGQLSPKIASSPVDKIQKVDNESLGIDKSGSFSRMKLGSQQCLINLLVFRQSVASVIPEETLKGAALGITKGSGDGAILSGRKVAATGFGPGDGRSECMEGDVFQPQLSALLATSRHHRASKGRNSKLGLSWRPELPSISENRPWVDLKPMNFINDFSVSLITSINTSMKTLASGPHSVSINSTAPNSLPNSLSPVSSSPNISAPTVRLFEELARPDRPLTAGPSTPLTSSQKPSASPRISSSPSRISSSPSGIPSSHSRITYFPSRVPSSPSRVLSSPSRVPNSPSRVPSSPSRASSLIVGSSPLSARSPARVTNHRRKCSSSPAHVPNSSVHFPCSPARMPSSPARILDSPMQFPSSPARVPNSSPLHFPSTRFPPSPLQFLGSPSVFHPSPLPRVCSPARGPGSPSVCNFQRQRFVYSA